MTDRQKICRCGANVAEFIKDIRILEMSLKRSKVENSNIFIPAFRSSVNTIFTDINNIENDCAIDARDTKWSHADLFNKIEKIQESKDSKMYDEKRTEILKDLDRISYGVVQKVKECSK